jgi:endonuclease/exonuclease/phosphatase family metal-dependent hydrolase
MVFAAVTILTFNTWGLPEPIAHDRAGRFPAIAEYLEHEAPDLAGLQEVWHGSLSLLHGLDGLFAPERTQGDSGLALWTHHDVSAFAVTPFAASRGLDAWKSKGILEATVDLPDEGPVEVFVTHLQAGPGPRNATVRAAQIDELLAAVARTSGAAVVMGDFNLYDGDATDAASLGRLVAAGLVDAATATGCEAPSYTTSSDRFDRVYLRGGDLLPDAVEVVAYDDDPATEAPPPLSDHFPVRVRLHLEPKKP